MKRTSILLSGILRVASAFLLMGGVVSCRQEQDNPLPEENRTHAHFSIVVDDIRDVVRTKTVLTDDSIETKITSVTVAVYSVDGTLVEKRYLTAGFDDIRYLLGFDETFLVYAVANMGDMRASFPPAISGEDALSELTYSIPAYSIGEDCINTRGIPMAGKLVYASGNGDTGGEEQIVMTRLLSKLQVHLSCQWPGTFSSVKIYNLNRTLKPFGVSAAVTENDIMEEQEIHIPATDAKEGDFLFYIPENRQGDIPEIRSPEEKSRDNEIVSGKDLKTYLEAVVTGVSQDGVNGTLTYRSYLGGNNSSDFDILRNSRYVWDVTYLPDNLQNNDWKHGNALSWKEFEYSLSVPSYLYWKERDYASLSIYSNTYENGAFVQRKKDNSSKIPSVTYSVNPADGSVLGNPSARGSEFSFTGNGPGVGTVVATCVDPFNPGGVNLSGQVRVLDFSREVFLRTPSGDYYDGETVPIPMGTTWENLKVGMRITRADGTVRTICPVVIGSDNLTTGIVIYPRQVPVNLALLYYMSGRDSGKEVVFSHTFVEEASGSTPNRFMLSCFYKDFNNESHGISAYITAEMADVDTELLALGADREEAYWSGGSISLTASSTRIHNGKSGERKDITGSGDYSWTVTGSVPGMNPRLELSGGKRVLTASRAGTVTVTVAGNGVSASRTVTFDDKITYRLNVTPKTRNVKAGDTFRTDEFTVRQDEYVNGVYHSSEPFQGLLMWSVKSGSSSLLKIQSGTVTARAEGTGYLRAYTYSSLIESGYGENEITVNIGQADKYTISLSPASVSIPENGNSSALTFDVRNNGVPVTGLAASDLVWHTRNSAVATVSGGIVTGKTVGSTKVYATYAGASSNEVAVTVVPAITFRYKVATSVSPSGIKVGQTSTARAVRYKKTYVNGVASTDWVPDGEVTSSGFADTGHSGKVTVSGNVITGIATGSVTIRSQYSADEYEDATLTVSDADYSVSVTPSSGEDLILGRKASRTYTAVATRNGQPDSGGSFAWSLSQGAPCSLNTASGSSVTVSASTSGSATLTVNYKVGSEIKASASVSFKVYDNSLVLSLDKNSIPVNANALSAVTFRSNDGSTVSETPVTGSATIKVYASETGSAPSSKVTVSSGGTLTGKEAGECWVEATCPIGGYSYTSNRARLTVVSSPLQLGWSAAGTPSYVAQQGLLEAGGLEDGNASVSYTVLSGTEKVRLVPSGRNTYVGLLAPGSYTIKATASNGQEGTISGQVTAPALSANVSTLYANPDGSEARTGPDGLSGNTLAVSYRAGTTPLTVSADAVAVGGRLNRDLYDELLAPQYSATGSLVHAGTDGIWASDVYSSTGGISTVTVSARGKAAGVSDVTVTVMGVHPFPEWGAEAETLPDEEDFGLVNRFRMYKNVSYRQHAVEFPGIIASDGQCGIEVLRNGKEVSSEAFGGAFESTCAGPGTKWETRYTLSPSALSEHTGGLVELKGYVRNRRSGKRLYRDGARFGLYVNGAIGARMSGIGTNSVTISTAFCGDEASYGFGMVTSVKLVGTHYRNGDSFGYIPNTSVTGIPVDGSALNSPVYTLFRSGGTLDSAARIMEAEKPRFEFRSVSGVGVFVEDDLGGGFYLLRPSGTPEVTDRYGRHGYYKLWLLETISDSPLLGPKAGWLLDN